MKSGGRVRAFNIVIVLFVAVTVGGCKRSVCGFEHGGLDAALEGAFASHTELFPEGATVCGHFTRAGKKDLSSVTIDFADDENPMVRIVKHLESKGFKRTAQDLSNADDQTATFDAPTGFAAMSLLVLVKRDRGRSSAEYALP